MYMFCRIQTRGQKMTGADGPTKLPTYDISLQNHFIWHANDSDHYY